MIWNDIINDTLQRTMKAAEGCENKTPSEIMTEVRGIHESGMIRMREFYHEHRSDGNRPNLADIVGYDANMQVKMMMMGDTLARGYRDMKSAQRQDERAASSVGDFVNEELKDLS